MYGSMRVLGNQFSGLPGVPVPAAHLILTAPCLLQVQDLEAQLKQVLAHQSKVTEQTPLNTTVV